MTRIIIAPVAAAFTWNAWSGRDSQLNIWIGITVKPELSHSKFKNGGSVVIGDGGKNAINVSAPMVIIGAVSPSARAIPIMMPVNTPPYEYFNTWS